MAEIVLTGSILTSGRALGTLVAIGAHTGSEPAEAPAPVATASESDVKRFRNEVAELAQDFQRIAAELENESKQDEAEIVRTHAELVSDDEFRRRVERTVSHGHLHRDPICGMSVEPASTPFWISEKGKAVYFCSSTCLRVYREQKEESDG